MLLRLFQKSIRAKIIALCMTLVASIAVSTAIYFSMVQKQSILEAMQLRDHALAEMVAIGVGIGMEDGDFSAVTKALEWAKGNEDLLFLMVLDERGEVIASFDPDNLKYDATVMSELNDIVSVDGTDLHLVKTPIEHHGEQIGTLYYGNSLGAEWATIRNTITNVILLSLAILIIGALVAFTISGTITRPLKELQLAARKMAEGNIDVQVTVKSSDEVGVLGEIFNEMASYVRNSVETLRESRKESRLIIDTAVEAFVSVDHEGIVLDWNTQAERTFGWTRQEILGESLPHKIILPSHRDIFMTLFRRCRKVTRPFRLKKPLVLAALHSNGDVISIEAQIWTIRREGRTVLNAFVREKNESDHKKTAEYRSKVKENA